MARISLREYIHEIESLIDRGDTQKAITHCKFILRYFPKHIDTYRLFGKALLEIQKFGDASDIFQRVLSSVPDDFISQIGMSIIREDENNLDAAIWHLERAFEIQPSNKAVQDELKRLYSSRDGVTPTKIRLTRGALVRMYARGELYPQAIAEIKAALDEDPNRVDLEVILARLYFLLEQKLDATETCSSLISKLPFCYEANRILAELLPGTSREEDAKIFKQRVIDLDPYFAFVSENTPNPIDIPDNKVMMEYLDWEPGMEEKEQEQPDWAKSIGINWDTDSTNESSQIESWLKSESSLMPDEIKEMEEPFTSNNESQLDINQFQNPKEIFESEIVSPFADPESEIVSPFVDPEIENTQNLEENLPNWMVEAGWESSKEQNETIQKGFNLEINEELTEKTEGEEIVLGAIPDWIQKLAPKEIHEMEEDGIIPDMEYEVDRLNSIFASPKPIESFEDTIPFDNSSVGRKSDGETNPILISEEALASEFFENEVKSDEFIKISFEENEFSSEYNSELPVEQDESFNEIQTEKMSDLEFSSEPASNSNLDSHVFATDYDNNENLAFEASINEYPISATEKDLNNLPAQPEFSAELNLPEFDSDHEMDWLQNLIQDEEKPQILTTDDLLSSNLGSESIDKIQESADIIKPSGDDFSWLNALQMDVETNELEFDDNKINLESVSDNHVEINQSLIQENENLAEVNAFSEELEEELEVLDLNEINEEVEIPTSEDISKNLFEDEQHPINIENELIPDHLPEFFETSTEKPDNLIENPEEIEINLDNLPEYLSDTSLEISDISLEEKTPDWIETLIKEIPKEQDLEPILNDNQSEFVVEDDQIATIENNQELDDESEIGAALAWMEGLAVKHGAEESSLFSKPEERDETPPDWIKAFQDEAEKDLNLENFVDSPKPENLFDDLDMTPSWLQELHLEASENEGKTDELVNEKEEEFEFSENVEFQNEELVRQSESTIDSPSSVVNETRTFPEIEIQEFIDDNEIIPEKINELETQESIITNAEIGELILGDEAEVTFPEKIEEQFQGILNQEKTKTKDLIDHSELINTTNLSEQFVTENYTEIPNQFELDQNQIEKELISEPTYTITSIDGKNALDKGNIEEAVSIYEQLIKSNDALDVVITDLTNALNHHFPISIPLWQTLGDAYLRKNQLKNALAAYSKAEDLLI